ncbi:MAG: hypothetical protein Harvfovirus10_24 [Harvfovirus sp.]|uniref:Uncharacterized protein n=1 Tax=Harvfovirus sp. TaxID=2487768 RepID=A0A3G5A112_9VIRU|nr:MAG: hypothetical protein Harvfovirus10_24 [Harvfovirus sp.]
MENKEYIKKITYWKDAESFEDLCQLMNLALAGKIDSFMSGKRDETNCVLDEESMKYKDDFLKLNSLGFLTHNSQPGIIEIISDLDQGIANFFETPSYLSRTIPEGNMICQQRNYLVGFIEKKIFNKILPSLKNYIIFLHSFPAEKSNIKMISNYATEINQKIEYVFIPNGYKFSSPMNFCDKLFNKRIWINMSRIICSYGTDACTNEFTDYDPNKINYYFGKFRLPLRDWMIDNVYNVTIIDPEYGKNNLNKFLLNLLDENSERSD